MSYLAKARTAAADHPVPAWLEHYVAHWQARLDLHEWTMEILINTVVCGDEATRGACCRDQDHNRCALVFRADIADTLAWRETVIHELVHVAMARIDDVVENAIAMTLPKPARTLAWKIYRQPIESFVARLAAALLRLEGDAA